MANNGNARKRVTSRDVAAHAGVSRTTVSFVLNDVRHAKISDETRQRVLRAADVLGYVPHAAARALAGGKSGTLGLLVRPFSIFPVDAFLQQMIHSLVEVCLEHGYRLLVETAGTSPSPETYLQMVRFDQIDALVVLGVYDRDPALAALMRSGFPTVLVGQFDDPVANMVFVDNEAGMKRATDHLIALGHRRFGFVHFVAEGRMDGEHRLRGFTRSLAEGGLGHEPDLVVGGNFSAASGYAAMQGLLANRNRPTAVVAGNDTVAIGAMAAIREAGLRIPDDLAVVGFDDVPMARFAAPALTTIRLPAYAMGRACGELAIAAINGDTAIERIRPFESRLIVRHSCGALSMDQPLDE